MDTEIDRIRKIQDNSNSNEAQEIVNSDLDNRLSVIEGVVITGKAGTKVNVTDKFVQELNFTSDPQTQLNNHNIDLEALKNITIINCGTSEGMGGS